MEIPEQPTIPSMPAPKPAKESNKTHEYPEALIPVSIAKELSNNDLKLIIKELHNISQELNALNKNLRRR